MNRSLVVAAAVIGLSASLAAQASVLQIGYTNGEGNPTATSNAFGYPSQIVNQGTNPTGTYVQAVGQTFTTPASTENMVLTNFAVQLCGAAMANAPTDLGAFYSLKFTLFDSGGNALMSKTGTYLSWGWHNHFEYSESNNAGDWLFIDNDTASLPQLTGNTTYSWEVQVLSAAGGNTGNATGLYASCVADGDAPASNWLSNGAGYFRNSDGTTFKPWSWDYTDGVDTNFTMQFTTVPEPITLTILAMGGVGLLRRRIVGQ